MAISTIPAVKKVKRVNLGQKWGSFSSTMAALMFIWTIYKSYFPSQLRSFMKMLKRFVSQYIQISFPQYQGEGFQLYRTPAYQAIERYLHKKSSDQAQFLTARVAPNSEAIVLGIEDNEEVIDEFQGIRTWWASRKQNISNRQSISYNHSAEERRYFRLTFHKKHREIVTIVYLKHVLGEATFDTLAMEPEKKKEIMDDLINFSKAKEFYTKIGKAWKRGYLLYGPPS
ncbi:OLC1v1004992C1 [Oldenlandia corymbosa var. corymbosa]|uniref:OLC1v1004992C1 n=1 Tax=Oldenlandia corymbosa var. corymbosa TaxID=529605 RepID=A0AAV1DDL7_OLDCO|nr:OLC1v1004992C1 [Oldenlandia corymbosa var. corymbosa]